MLITLIKNKVSSQNYYFLIPFSEEYLLCLRTHVRASLKDNATPFLSVECYVELIESSQGIEDEICYLRQLLTFLDDNIQALKSQTTCQDVIQEVIEINILNLILISLNIYMHFVKTKI